MAVRAGDYPNANQAHTEAYTTAVNESTLAVLRHLHVELREPGGGLVFTGYHGGTMEKDYLNKRFRIFRNLAKLPSGKTFHSTRHTYASWLVQAGRLAVVKELCGHK